MLVAEPIEGMVRAAAVSLLSLLVYSVLRAAQGGAVLAELLYARDHEDSEEEAEEEEQAEE